jgi:hypothetical protein
MIMNVPDLKPEVVEKLIRMGPPPTFFDDAFTNSVLKQIAKQRTAHQSNAATSSKKTVKAKLPPIKIKITKVFKQPSTSRTRSDRGRTGDHVKK